MMKGLGGLLIILAGLILGVEKLRPIKKRLDTLEQLCHALERLHGELGSRPAAIGELFSGLVQTSGEEAAGFFRLVLQRMDRLSAESFSEIWHGSLGETMPALEEEERRELEKLGGILGRYDLSEQLAAMNLVLDRLREILHRLKENYPASRKLCIGVSCSLSAMLALVLF